MGHVLIRSDGLAAVLVADDGYPVRTAFSILENVLYEFTCKFPNKELWVDMNPTKSHSEYPELAKHLDISKDPQKADPFSRIQKHLDETIDVVVCSFASFPCLGHCRWACSDNIFSSSYFNPRTKRSSP